VGILAKGKVVIEGSIDQLGREALAGGRYIIEIETASPGVGLIETIRNMKGVVSVEVGANILKVSTDADLRAEIARAVVQSGAPLVQMKVQEFSLDDIYMKYFKES
jgi:ABC-2 type transport system ATP-binding protein